MLRLAKDYLETENLSFRRPAKADAAELAVAANHKQVADMLATMPHPYGETDALDWIDGMANAPKGAHAFVLRLRSKDNRIVGTCGYGPRKGTGEIEFGFWITPDVWGRGLATEAGHAVLTHGFCLTMVDVMSADVQKTNPASLRVLEKLGFMVTGERKRHSKGVGGDVETWQLELAYDNWLARQAA